MIQYLWENILNKKDKENDVITFLKNTYLFKDLNSSEIKFLEQIIHIRDFRPNERIFKQGDPGLGMFLIFSGSVDIIMHDPKSDGLESTEEIFVTRLKAGDFFGELSLVEEPSYRSASAVSINRSRLIGFFKPDLVQILQRNSHTGNKISMRLAEILGRRLRETTEKVTELAAEMKQLNNPSKGQNLGKKHFTS